MTGVNFKGLGVAMITPFRTDGSIDFEGLENLTEHIIKGADYLVVCGTTAETPTLSKDEKKAILAFIQKVNNGRLPIVYGAGGNNTLGAVEEIKEAVELGVDAILSVVPYYNKPTTRGMYAHFSAIAASTEVPIILYNIPGRTGVNMPAEITLQLANEFSNIVGIKEASGNLEQMQVILDEKPEDFLVISGDDSITLDLIRKGGAGVISVLGNAYPEEWGAMVGYAMDGKFQEASEIDVRFREMNHLLFVDGNPAGVKAVCAELGIIENVLRLPMVPAREETIAALKAEM